MSEEAQRWLDGPRDYQEGVALFDRLGKARHLKRLFNRLESEFTRRKLAYELTKLAGTTPAGQKQKGAGSDPVKIDQEKAKKTYFSESKFQKVDFATLPEQFNQDKVDLVRLFNEADRLHFSLDDMPQDERLDAIRVIENNFQLTGAIWKKIDRFLDTGELPEEQAPEPTLSSMELHRKLINRIRPNLSKWRRLLANEKDLQRREALQYKINTAEEEKARIEHQLSQE